MVSHFVVYYNWVSDCNFTFRTQFQQVRKPCHTLLLMKLFKSLNSVNMKYNFQNCQLSSPNHWKTLKSWRKNLWPWPVRWTKLASKLSGLKMASQWTARTDWGSSLMASLIAWLLTNLFWTMSRLTNVWSGKRRRQHASLWKVGSY